MVTNLKRDEGGRKCRVLFQEWEIGTATDPVGYAACATLCLRCTKRDLPDRTGPAKLCVDCHGPSHQRFHVQGRVSGLLEKNHQLFDGRRFRLIGDLIEKVPVSFLGKFLHEPVFQFFF